jgi:hypothetical protein
MTLVTFGKNNKNILKTLQFQSNRGVRAEKTGVILFLKFGRVFLLFEPENP